MIFLMSGMVSHRTGYIRPLALLLVALTVLSGTVRGIALDFCFCTGEADVAIMADPCCPQPHANMGQPSDLGPLLLRSGDQDSLAPCVELRLSSDMGVARVITGSVIEDMDTGVPALCPTALHSGQQVPTSPVAIAATSNTFSHQLRAVRLRV